MSLDTEFWCRVKVAPLDTKRIPLTRKKRIIKKIKAFRDAIFRLLFPGMFVVLVYYHLFIYSAEVPRFYVMLIGNCLNIVS